MKSAALHLQQAVVALCRAALAPVPVYDGAPRNAILPFAVLAEVTTRRRDGLMAVIEEHRFAIRLSSKAGGKAEAMTLADAVIAVLDDASPALTDHRVIRLSFEASDSRLAKDRIAAETTLKFLCLTEPLVEPTH